MANLFSNPQHSAKLGYNGFDMSKRVKFSSSVGQLLPVYYDLLQPGDKVDIKADIKTRLMPMNSSAYANIEEHIDFFFVPIEQLYHAFSEFYYGVQDFNSNFFESATFQKLFPNFTYADLANMLAKSIDDDPANFTSAGAYNYFASNLYYKDTLRLLDLLGINIGKLISAYNETKISDIPLMSINPIFLLAYQKIYYDYYRLNDREANNPNAYNVDKFYNVANNRISFTDYSSIIKEICRLHYVPFKKDFFTNGQISPIFSSDNVSSVPNYDYNAVNQWLTGLADVSLIDVNGEYTSGGKATAVGIDSQSIVSAGQAVSTASIRTMFAVEKLLEITRRAGKHYDKQTLAHFGVDVPDGISGECTFIDGQQSSIDIGEVFATAAGVNGESTSVLGEVGGKGFGRTLGSGQFTANCHGILMGIYYARPSVDYQPTYIDRLHTLVNSADWFKPEFDDLGMQPLFAYQEDFEGNTSLVQNTQIKNWQYRYSELKTKFDSVHGVLAHNPQMRSWVISKIPNAGDMLSNYLVKPTTIDSLFVLPYNGGTYQVGVIDKNTLFTTDPMIHSCLFDVKKASKMSTYGLPSL